MLDGASPWHHHFLQNVFLIFLSILFSPLSTLILLSSYLARPFVNQNAARRQQIRQSPTFLPKTILVTGIGMSKGLVLARTFYEAGHDVIGADFEYYGIPVIGRFSRVLLKFYALPAPNEKDGSAFYIHELLRITRREKVDLWVSCSGVASAIEDAQAKEVLERRSDCIAIQFDVATTSTLHEKHTFIQRTRKLGLPVPETHNVTSRAAVHKVLHSPAAAKKKYIMKSVDTDDANRGNMTLLPRRNVSETYSHVSKIPISSSKPWVLQQYIPGREYCTHALVVHNAVKIFVACPSSELLMHYEALPPTAPLSRAMLRFTQVFAARSPPGFTGHLSFDFLIDEDDAAVSEKGLELVLRPIECNPRAHTAVVLFRRTPSADIAAAYLSALRPPRDTNTDTETDKPTTGMNGRAPDTTHPQQSRSSSPNNQSTSSTFSTPHDDNPPIHPLNPPKTYWLGHDLITLLIHPFLSLLPLHPFSPAEQPSIPASLITFATHLLTWSDGTFALDDPLPAWWLYHGYWPARFAASVGLGWRGGGGGGGAGKWSRVNVSTNKVFGC